MDYFSFVENFNVGDVIQVVAVINQQMTPNTRIGELVSVLPDSITLKPHNMKSLPNDQVDINGEKLNTYANIVGKKVVMNLDSIKEVILIQ